MLVGTDTAELRQCRGCGWWAHWLNLQGRCGNCVMGWAHCLDHGRLEWAASMDVPTRAGGHRRVSTTDVKGAARLRSAGDPGGW